MEDAKDLSEYFDTTPAPTAGAAPDTILFREEFDRLA